MQNHELEKRWMVAERALARLDEAATRDTVRARYLADAIRCEAASSVALEGAFATVQDVARAVISPTSYAYQHEGAGRACDVRTALLAVTEAKGLEAQWVERVVRASLRAIDADAGIEAGIITAKVLRELQRVMSGVEGYGLRGLAWAFRELQRSDALADAVPGSRGFAGQKLLAPMLARALTPWMVCALGITSHPVLFLSAALKKSGGNRAALYGSDDVWQLWFLDIVAVTAHQSLARLRDLELIKRQLRKQLREKDLQPPRIRRYIDWLFQQPVVTAKSLANKFEITERGARKLLDVLVDKKVVREITGNSSFRVYAAPSLTAAPAP